jgi:hypothetical protein
MGFKGLRKINFLCIYPSSMYEAYNWWEKYSYDIIIKIFFCKYLPSTYVLLVPNPCCVASSDKFCCVIFVEWFKFNVMLLLFIASSSSSNSSNVFLSRKISPIKLTTNTHTHILFRNSSEPKPRIGILHMFQEKFLNNQL